MAARLASPRWAFPLFVLLALLIRSPLFGDPVIQSDEQFYLLVGDRMLHGAVPYVDIWDRKPVGLFIIYAAIRLLGGVGIVQYQVVASLFAGATAGLVSRIAARFSTPLGALTSGAAYLLWLMLFDGAGGQSPVFYNLPVAAAGLLLLDLVRGRGIGARTILERGVLITLLLGIALQVNYACLFEGLFFGLILLWRLHGARPGLLILLLAVGLWCAVALLPTLAVAGWYAIHGQFDAFVESNFVSIFLRSEAEPAKLGAIGTIVGLLPLVLCALLPLPSSHAGHARLFLLGWGIFAFAGGELLGHWDAHYLLPALVPLSAAAALAFVQRTRRDSPRNQATLSAAVLSLGLIASVFMVRDHLRRRGNAQQIEALVRLIRPNLRGGCMFAFGAEPILYHLTSSCLPTRFIFRSHLSQTREARAIGLDQLAEVRRVMNASPTVVVIRAPRKSTNKAAFAIVIQAMQDRYLPAGAVKVGASLQSVYVLRTAPRRGPQPG